MLETMWPKGVWDKHCCLSDAGSVCFRGWLAMELTGDKGVLAIRGKSKSEVMFVALVDDSLDSLQSALLCKMLSDSLEHPIVIGLDEVGIANKVEELLELHPKVTTLVNLSAVLGADSDCVSFGKTSFFEREDLYIDSDIVVSEIFGDVAFGLSAAKRSFLELLEEVCCGFDVTYIDMGISPESMSEFSAKVKLLTKIADFLGYVSACNLIARLR